MGSSINISFYITLIFIFGGTSLLLMNFGTDIASYSTTLSQDSLDYIADYNLQITGHNISKRITGTSIAQLQEDKLILEDDDVGEQSKTDFLANLNVIKTQINKITTPLKLTYMLPSFVLNTMGLNIPAWSALSHVINLVTFISLTIIIIKLFSGGT
jgi:hypothetical protein